MSEITIDKNAKQITFTNNGIGFSQFGIANEILDLIENQTKEIERLNKENEYLNNKHEKIIHNIMKFIDKNTFNHRNTGERILTLHGKGILDLLDICLGSDKE